MGDYKRAIEIPKKRKEQRIKKMKWIASLILLIIFTGTMAYSVVITMMYDELRESVINNPNIPIKERERYKSM